MVDKLYPKMNLVNGMKEPYIVYMAWISCTGREELGGLIRSDARRFETGKNAGVEGGLDDRLAYDVIWESRWTRMEKV